MTLFSTYEDTNHGRHQNGHGSPMSNSSHRDSHANHGLSSSNNHHNFSNDGYQYGRFDASALHIAHALKQTEIQKGYAKAREKPIDFYLVSHNSCALFIFLFLFLFFTFPMLNARAKFLKLEMIF